MSNAYSRERNHIGKCFKSRGDVFIHKQAKIIFMHNQDFQSNVLQLKSWLTEGGYFMRYLSVWQRNTNTYEIYIMALNMETKFFRTCYVGEKKSHFYQNCLGADAHFQHSNISNFFQTKHIPVKRRIINLKKKKNASKFSRLIHY